MTCSASSSASGARRAAPLLLASLLAGCVARQPVPAAAASPPPAGRIALLPLVNLSGAPADLGAAQAALAADLERAGVRLVPPAELDAFLARHRVRHTGGLDGDTARLLGEELGVAAFAAGSLDLLSASGTPRAAMTLRLVGAASPPAILWMDGLARAGDDAPGAFGLGQVHDLPVLQAQLSDALAHSLAAYLFLGRPAEPCPAAASHAPRIRFRRPLGAGDALPVVAVLPFRNESDRPGAGEVLALQLVRRLSQLPSARVIEPGAVRAELLRNRIVMEGGVTYEAARMALATLGVDVVLGGQVFSFSDAVDFSAVAIRTHDNRTVWSSSSAARLDDSRLPFELGRLHSPNDLACGMARALADQLVPAWAPGAPPAGTPPAPP